MIPYAILAGQIAFSSLCPVLDIRILDVSPDYFTFRLSHRHRQSMKEVKEIILYFYQYEEEQYQKIIVSQYTLLLQESQHFFDLYRVTVGQEERKIYAQAVGLLSREYLTYMERKQYLSEEELAALMTSYPMGEEECFALPQEEQIREWSPQMLQTIDEKHCHDLHYSMLLDTPEKLQQYLSMEMKKYVQIYWCERGLAEHVYAKAVYTGIHIGNAFCPHLLPDLSLLESVLKKAGEESLSVTFLLPPVSQSLYEETKKMLWNLHAYLRQAGEILEIEVGDLGIYAFLSGKDFPCFRVSKGILLHKHPKDSRILYYQEPGKVQEKYQIDYSDRGLYLPLYQMNTGTFCPWYAMKKHGKRGAGHRVLSCHRECLSGNFRYPKHLRMMGRYNSLFGVNMESMTNQKLLEEMTREKKCSWVVMNL